MMSSCHTLLLAEVHYCWSSCYALGSCMVWLQDTGNRLWLLVQNTIIMITSILNVINYNCDYILNNHRTGIYWDN